MTGKAANQTNTLREGQLRGEPHLHQSVSTGTGAELRNPPKYPVPGTSGSQANSLKAEHHQRVNLQGQSPDASSGADLGDGLARCHLVSATCFRLLKGGEIDRRPIVKLWEN